MTDNTLNPNLLTSLYQNQAVPSLKLTQIDTFEPVVEFTDSTGAKWRLIKSANSSMGEIPDPKSINFTDCWNHEFPGSNAHVYVYVVEGVKLPRTPRETSCKVLYQWFSSVNNKSFNPQMIRAEEWLIANVYASAITDARVSKLKALCKIDDSAPAVNTQPVASAVYEPAPLISPEVLNGNDTRDTAVRQTTAGNKGKCNTNNRQ